MNFTLISLKLPIEQQKSSNELASRTTAWRLEMIPLKQNKNTFTNFHNMFNHKSNIQTVIDELKNTSKVSSLLLHFNMPLTPKAQNKSFGVEEDDSRVPNTDLQIALLNSAVFSIPSTSKVLRASYASSKLAQTIDDPHQIVASH